MIETVRRDQIIIALYGFAGGFGDATSFLLFNTFTGHVTGNLVLMMVAVAHREWPGVAKRLLAIIVFLLATRLGFQLAPKSRSTAWLVLIQTVLLLPLLLLRITIVHLPLLGISLCCAALGVQNGVVTTAHGVSLHSTFLSGDFTKLLKPASATDSSKVPAAPRALLPCLIAGFALGALGASTALIVSPGRVFQLMCVCLWMAFSAKAFRYYR